MTESIIPKRSRGRQSAQAQAKYEVEVERFCETIVQINSRLDFRVSSRGWCYLLEEHGLGKGDFDSAQRLINDCRKSGHLPIQICADDDARTAINLEIADADADDDPIDDVVEYELQQIEEARDDAINSAANTYTPWGFWYSQDCYIEMLVEKIDLKELFKDTCRRFHIPLANSRGWPDINSRDKMMRRFQDMEMRGKQCVLMYCGDHDPAGLSISDQLLSMFSDLSGAVGWSPENLHIDRFGLNADFINDNGLTWIDGLETGSGRNLEDPRHKDHKKPYVQSYLNEYGAHKVEANALVTRPEAGRKLCLESICKYLDPDAPRDYAVAVDEARQHIRQIVFQELEDGR